VTASVYVCGPASWNRIVLVERLPDPISHMQFALEEWETLGGTSAGKAIGLASLGRSVHLQARLADDEDAAMVRLALRHPSIELVAERADRTERHLNLMTAAGERVSISLSLPAVAEVLNRADVTSAMAAADVVVLDLADSARSLIPTALSVGRPIWTDVHDYDGIADYQRPFIDAAFAVFLNDDGLHDPLSFMRSVIAGGASLAVCTLGAEGAVALDAAGVAFFAGVLDATLSGVDLEAALRAGAAHAATALASRHLHPALDDVLG
jgi:sugar/nucleoside kinase (ribokinase family)